MDIVRWKSLLSGNGSTYTINPAENNPTDTIICTASVDTDGASVDTSSTITIENTEPTWIASASLHQQAVEANVTLEMIYSTSDIDVEALNVEFTWTDDTGTLLGTNSLTIDNTRPVGSTITATITVADGYGGLTSLLKPLPF